MAVRNRIRKPISRRQRAIVTTVTIAVLLAMVVSQRVGFWNPPAGTDRQRYHNKIFTVVKVVDGDTIDLDVPDHIANKPYTRIRLWGVDTPETVHPTRPVMYYGPEASAFVKETTLNKDVKVFLEPFEESRGKYGRLLAYIYLPNGQMLNEQLIIEGYGYADPRFKHVKREKFKQLQKQAKKEKRGLWKEVKGDQFPHWYRQ